MTDQKPCSSPDNDPEDWFISRDGKQYPDDEFLTDAERQGIARSVLQIMGESAEGHQRRVDRAITHVEAERRRRALQRRRQAREKCYSQCKVRTDCLEKALKGDHVHGTWGGYLEEELRELRKEIARRKCTRATTSSRE